VVETFGRRFDDSRYGITTVKPNRAFKKCRIRNLRIEYIISDMAVILTIPRSCGKCECMDDCTDDFILQIIEKLSGNQMPPETHYFLP
jgi:hypothetical protein